MQDTYTVRADQSTAAVHTPKRFSFDTAAVIALMTGFGLSFVAFLPFASVPFFHTKILLVAFGVIFALIFYILGRLTKGSAIVPPLTLVGIFWLVPLAYLLSMFFSGISLQKAFLGDGFSVDTFGFTLLLAFIATLTAMVFRRQTFYRFFFIGAAWLAAFILLAQWIFIVLGIFMPTVVSGSTTLVGSFVDFGLLATLTVILTLIAFRFFEFSAKTEWFMYALLGLGFVGALLTNNLTYWIIIALVSFGLFVETILRRTGGAAEDDLEGVTLVSNASDVEAVSGRKSSKSFIISIVTLCLSVFFILGSNMVGAVVTNTLHISFIDVHPSWQSTFSIGSHTLGTSPFLGSGPGTFAQQWLQFRDAAINNSIFWNTGFDSGVSTIATSFVTTGLLGTLAWLLFLGFLLYSGARTLFGRMPENKFARFATLASFVGTFYLFLLALLQTPGPLALMLGALFLGLFVSSQRFAGVQQEWGIVFARSPRIGFIIVFVLTLALLGSVITAYGLIGNYLSDLSYTKAVIELNEGKLDAAQNELQQSAAFSASDRTYRAFAFLNIARMNQIAGDTTLSQTTAQQSFQTALQTAVQAGMAATKDDAKNYQNWIALASVYQSVVPLKVAGAYDNAKAAYQQAVKLDPTAPELQVTLAQLEISNGNMDGAKEYLNQAIALKRDYTQAIFLLSQVEAQQGHTQDALSAAEAALYFAPTDQNVLLQVGLLRSARGDSKGAIDAFQQALEVNPQFANARYFLGVMYAITGDYAKAADALAMVAAQSPENAKAVENDLAALKQNKNPFPPSRLGALGLTAPSVSESTTAETKPKDSLVK